ncbi:MAG: LCP family protein, partial [Gallicola sp.]|nr:LCP family protein [Gallicola sp.]
LMVGVDENSQMEKKDENTRTDTIMLAKVNLDTGSADVLSIPRDTKVKINGEYHKINAAHAYGGMTLTLQTIRNFLGVDLDYYVAVNFKAVEEVVDAIGGIEVNNQHRIVIPREEVDIPAGKIKLNGKDALAFVRNREFDNGDLGRVDNQQKFMMNLLDQVISPANITKVPQLFNIYKKDVKTNIPSDIIAGVATKIGNINKDKVNFHTIPGQPVNEGISYYVADKEETLKLVDNIFGDYLLTEAEIQQQKEGNVDEEQYNDPEINKEMNWQNQH